MCHGSDYHEYVMRTMGTAIHDAARSGKLEVAGFPDVQKIVGGLRAHKLQMRLPELRVTVLTGDGLVIQRRFDEAFACEWTKDPFNLIKQSHNVLYNPQGKTDCKEAPKSSQSTLYVLDNPHDTVEKLYSSGKLCPLHGIGGRCDVRKRARRLGRAGRAGFGREEGEGGGTQRNDEGRRHEMATRTGAA